MSDRLVGVRAKIERAEQHIRDVDGAIQAFFNFNPYAIGEKADPQTGQWIYYVTRLDDVPFHIGIIAGDAINNLRCALDHLAMRFSIKGGGSPDGIVYYPIIDTTIAAEYKSKRSGKVGSMRQDAIDFIDATEPYQGGAGHELWMLNKLNNIDKHRRMNLIATSFGGFWTNPELLRLLKASAKANPSLIGSSPPGYYFRPEHDRSPLKVGDELFRCPAHAKLDQHNQFTFDIAFGEPQILECKPISEFLHEVAHLIDGIVSRSAYLLL